MLWLSSFSRRVAPLTIPLFVATSCLAFITNRVSSLLHLGGFVDVVLPRGSAGAGAGASPFFLGGMAGGVETLCERLNKALLLSCLAACSTQEKAFFIFVGPAQS